MNSKDYQEFRVEALRHESPKAYLFKFEGCEEPVWVPKSQCDWDEDSFVVHISKWLVDQKPELEALLKDSNA